MTENELLLTKIKELENVVDDVHLLKTEVQRLRDKNSSDWNYWRKQQSDLYAQLRQQHHVKEAILYRFDRLQKQVNNHVAFFFVNNSCIIIFIGNLKLYSCDIRFIII